MEGMLAGLGERRQLPGSGVAPAWRLAPLLPHSLSPLLGTPLTEPPLPSLLRALGTIPNLVSIPWGQPPNPFGVPAAGEGGAWLRVVLGVSSSPLPSLFPPPCWVPPSPGRQRGCFAAFIAGQWGIERWCCGKAGKIIIKGGGRNSIWAKQAARLSGSLPFFLSSFQRNKKVPRSSAR